MPRALPAASSSAPQYRPYADLQYKCLTCYRADRDPGRGDKRCTECGDRADAIAARDASRLPNQGLCTKTEWGALCLPGAHAPECMFWKAPGPVRARDLARVNQNAEAHP